LHTPNLPKAAQNTIQSLEMPLRHREAAERECARAKGVGSGERKARTAKQPPGPAREPKRSELTFLRLLSERAFTFERGDIFGTIWRNMKTRKTLKTSAANATVYCGKLRCPEMTPN